MPDRVRQQLRREIEFASHPANLCLVRDFVRQFLRPLGLADLEKDLIILGVDEACTNVIRYAYHQKTDQLICLICEHHDDGVLFRLRDYGAQCDPTALQGRPLDLVQPGGLGIHLIKRAFDRVDYNLKPEGTELVLGKRFMRASERSAAGKSNVSGSTAAPRATGR